MATLFDLVVLLGISKEGLIFASTVPQSLLILFYVVLPFSLGMGHALREGGLTVIRPRAGVMVGQLLTVTTVIIYVGCLFYLGRAMAFWGVFLSTMMPYIIGRWLGMTLKGVIGLMFLAVVALLLSRLA